MMQTIFLTGGNGFIGQALRARLALGPWRIRGLTRHQAEADADLALGDLLVPDTYRDMLRGADAVVHLAAATGKTPAQDQWRTNVEGTRALLAACQDVGVSRIVHVSTIAAGYADKRHYPYAQSKLAAEALVRDSGLAFTILRPTIVLGAGSRIGETLRRIAGFPMIPLPHGARPVMVQPVDVSDVARAVEIVLADRRFQGEVLDVGGADPETFADFLNAVRCATRGAPARIVHVPLGPIRAMLAATEGVASRWQPVTAGQMALFANDSIADDNWLMARLRPRMRSLGDILANLAGTPDPAFAPRHPGRDDIAKLERESQVFARYLTGAPPSEAAMRHYISAAKVHGIWSNAALSDTDRRSLTIARRSPWQARCVDAVSALVNRRGALRRKLIVLAAIIENQSPTNAIYEAPVAASRLGAVLRLAGYGSAFLAALLSGAVMLGAARIARMIRA